jgi:hypothetical protein
MRVPSATKHRQIVGHVDDEIERRLAIDLGEGRGEPGAAL